VTARRRATGLSGILPVDKPAGMTSHDVVNVVRRVTGEGRIGHAGTLDPAATGLLLVLVGPSTRLAPYLTSAYKEYEAGIVFGTETDTDDAQGRVVRSARVPESLAEQDLADRALTALLGPHEQVPPAFSAIKLSGRTAYDIARSGDQPQLSARSIDVRAAELLRIATEASLTWYVHFDVSKGTYVRALARDLGRALGTAAHLGSLRRTRSGRLSLADAHPLDEIEAHDASTITALFADPLSALDLHVAEVDPSRAALVANGVALSSQDLAPDLQDGPVALTRGGGLIAVYEKQGPQLVPAVVFPGSVTSR